MTKRIIIWILISIAIINIAYAVNFPTSYVYDDFTDNNINASKWDNTTTGLGTFTETGGYLKVYCDTAGSSRGWMIGQGNFYNSNAEIRIDARWYELTESNVNGSIGIYNGVTFVPFTGYTDGVVRSNYTITFRSTDNTAMLTRWNGTAWENQSARRTITGTNWYPYFYAECDGGVQKGKWEVYNINVTEPAVTYTTPIDSMATNSITLNTSGITGNTTNVLIVYNGTTFNVSNGENSSFWNTTFTTSNIISQQNINFYWNYTDSSGTWLTTRTYTQTIDPLMMNISFSQYTNATIDWLSGGGSITNHTNYTNEVLNMDLGLISIAFNGGTQLFQLFNPQNQSIYHYLYVEDPNLLITVQARSETQYLDDARVETSRTVGGAYMPVWASYTDGSGETTQRVRAGNLYKFNVTHPDCTSEEILEYIEVGRTDTVTIILECEDDITWEYRISDSCSGVIREETNCTHRITTYLDTTILQFNFSYSNGTTYGTTPLTGSSTNSTYIINNATGNITIETYVNNALYENITIRYMSEEDTPIRVTITEAQATWIRADPTRMKIFYFLFFILGLVIAGIFQNRIAGSGMHAFAIFTIATGIIYPTLLWWPAVIVGVLWGIYVIYEVVTWWK